MSLFRKMANESWIFKETPVGLPAVGTTFELKPCDEEKPAAGQLAIKPLFFSVDPYLRGRMTGTASYIGGYRVGEPLDSLFVGEVLDSGAPDKFSAGDLVSCRVGYHGAWKRQFVIAAEAVTKIDPGMAPLQAHLGVLGMPGMTAYFGSELAAPKAGETVFVSGAAGAVGSICGQLFKRHGCRVIGSAGSDEKVARLTSLYGFDAAWNYKTTSTADALKAHAPEGIDIYFDNVGGETLDAALASMRTFGRIICCGAISQYNTPGAERYGVKNMLLVIGRQLRLEGFIVGRWRDRFPAAVADMAGMLARGELKAEETVMEGFEKLPDAFLALFRGENVGKLVVKV